MKKTDKARGRPVPAAEPGSSGAGETPIGQSLRRYFRGDSRFSAADLAHLLAHSADPEGWLAALVGEARARWEDPSPAGPAEAFVFSRIVHTVASALERWVGSAAATMHSVLPHLPQRLAAADAQWLVARDLKPRPQEPVAGWAERAKNLAVDFLRQEILSRTDSTAAPLASALRTDELIWGRAPARLDLAGGWTDTPPFTLEHGGCVLNAAVLLNGQPPIQVFCRVPREPLIRLRSVDAGSQAEIRDWSQLLDYQRAGNEFSLVQAALLLAGFSPQAAESRTLEQVLAAFGGGIELTTVAAIPQGSGLGTSSIMGAVLLSVVQRLLGRALSPTALFHGVLRLEQALTTGGGWQDQIGGSTAGLKLISTAPGLIPQAHIRHLPADVLDPRLNDGQTLLYYTGITRLAKDILEQVVGRYLDRDREAMDVLDRLKALATQMAEVIAGKDLSSFGRLLDVAWQLNKRLDPHSSNEEIESLLGRAAPHIHGAKLLGAGGGGFLLLVCKSSDDAGRLKSIFQAAPPNPRARFFEFGVSPAGLALSVC